MSFRKEKKFRLTKSDYYEFKTELQRQGMTALFENRIINSVYFDTKQLSMYADSEEGVLPRKKIRIRWYDNKFECTLETKISSVEGRFKKSIRIFEKLSENDVLNKSIFDSYYGNLQPSLKITYERSYYTIRNMRITFDKNICYQNLRLRHDRKFLDPERVAEIKVSAHHSDDTIEQLVPNPTTRFSKYSRGILLSMDSLSEF
jgi:SPX domain protein involved in polyphosphate accumulation